MKSAFLFTFQLLILPFLATSYKILVIPVPGKSHVISLFTISEGLASRGHDVSVLLGQHVVVEDPPTLPGNSRTGSVNVVRYPDFKTDGTAIDYEDAFSSISGSVLQEGSVDNWQVMEMLSARSEEFCRPLITENHVMLEKLQQQRFDLAVVDGILFLRCLYLIPHRLRIPWITYCDVLEPGNVRVPWLPSFVPHMIFPFDDRMGFAQRLQNTLLIAVSLFYIPFPDPPQDVLDEYRRHGGDFRSLDELISRSLLWLITKDISPDYALPMMPSMISVGGLTAREPSGHIPDVLRSFVDAADAGVILVTFGSQFATLPSDLVRKFADAFGRLSGYRILWRLDNVDDVELPANVMVARWLPQNDLLGHASVKLFITHCGNNGQFETVYHAVPMIGFPLLGDQLHNGRRIEYKGLGIVMDVQSFTSDELLENIRRILTNRSYTDTISKASEIFRSQPQGLVERAAFWIEHVCKFGGSHLRSGGNELPLPCYLMLDILALVLVVLFCVVVFVSKSVRLCVRKCRPKSMKSDETKRKTD